jgi:hypothetical protein
VNLLLINIVRWRVPKEQSEKHLEFLRWWMDWVKSHPQNISSRLFTLTEEESSEENWMFLDEYEQREDFDRTMKATREGTELAKVIKDKTFPKWDAVIVPGSRKKGEVWTEVEKLRVEFK